MSPSTASTRLDPRCAHELTLPLPRAQRLSASRAHGSSPVLQVAAVPLLTVRDVRSASGPQGAAPDRLKNSDSRRRVGDPAVHPGGGCCGKRLPWSLAPQRDTASRQGVFVGQESVLLTGFGVCRQDG